MSSVDLFEISKKWQKIWEDKKLFEANLDKSKPKFFVTFPYPYLNGLLHLGHGLSAARVEFIARYKRMKGYNVLWPQGWHVTGAPIVASAYKLAHGDEKVKRDLVKLMHVPEEELDKFKNPEYWVTYFAPRAKEAFKRMGFSIDWRREFTTSYLHPWYNKFIEWQYIRLKEKGLVVKGEHPVVWDPVVQKVIGDHDRPDEYAGISILEGYIIFFRLYNDEYFDLYTKALEEIENLPTSFKEEIHELEELAKSDLNKALEKLNSLPISEDIKDKIKGILVFISEWPEYIILPTFTLRPETVLGVTNIWVNPNALYVVARDKDGKYYIVSKDIVEEFKGNKFDIEILWEISGKDLIRKQVYNPVTIEKVPILPANFVDPEVGTGIVMSVPAHAPFDYIALKDLTSSEEFGEIAKQLLNRMRSLFKVEGFSDFPAKDIVERMGIKSQEEKEKLEKATQEIYSTEYYNGVLKEIYGEFAGRKIHEVKEEFAKKLIKEGKASIYYTLPVRFKSRYGNKVIVKIVSDQWFLKYSDPEWKKLAHEAVDKMHFIPENLRKEFHHYIDWYKDWAFTHKDELGTYLPWDKQWVIESLSDSTIYMAFYTIAHLIKEIPPEKLDIDLFDFIFYGKGDVDELANRYGVSKDLLIRMREEFEYWYPLDLRSSAKDLIPNHLTFFIFHHTALFPKDKWPRGIAINGWVLINGEKMSKSKGNFIPILDAVQKYPVDVLRFLLAYAGNSGIDDLNLELSLADNVDKELKEWYEFAINNYGKGIEEKRLIDEWMENVLYRAIIDAEEEYEHLNYKNVINLVWYDLDKKFKWYHHRTLGKYNRDVISKYILIRTLLMYPIIPHLASEILEKLGYNPLNVEWPEYKEIDESILKLEDFVMRVREDIITVSNLVKRKGVNFNTIKIVIASKDKYKLVEQLKTFLEEYENLREAIQKAIENYREHYNVINRISKDLSVLQNYMDRDLEFKALSEAKEFLEREFGKRIEIIFEENCSNEKAKKALPTKPAIILE